MSEAGNKNKALILWFNEISIEDTPLVGGKNSSLGEMYRELTKKGVNIPNGFAITAAAYRLFLKEAGVEAEIKKKLAGLNARDIEKVAEAGYHVRELIKKAEFPPELNKAIAEAYARLSREYGNHVDVAVRSSATAEDLPSITADSHVLVKINGKPMYDTIENIHANFCKSSTLIEVAAMEEGEVVWRRAQQIYQHPAKAVLYKITTETGREIEITEDHSLITLDQETLEPKIVSVHNLQEDEFVPVTRAVPWTETTGDVIDTVEYIDGQDTHVENNMVYVKNNSSNWSIQHPLPRYIRMDEDFAYFLGIYCAEGCTYKSNEIIITNSDKAILERVKRFYKSLKLPTEQKINKHSLRVYCKSLVRLLHALTGKPLETKGKGRSCSIKRVPNLLFGCSPNLIGSFLTGCIDGDGYVSKDAIGYCSISKLLSGGIIKLLEMLNIQFYLRQKENAYIITIPTAEAKKLSGKLNLSPNKAAKLQKLIKGYERKEFHPEFKNVLSISPALSEKLKHASDENLPKEAVQTAICPQCSDLVEQTSYYGQQRRYFCRPCHKTFYEEDVRKETTLRYKYYDGQGKFTEGMSPWNKGIVSGRTSQQQFTMLMTENSVSQYSDFFNKSVQWDRIREIEAFPYNGMVYDFTVPEVENFAAGMGGIITHNSASFAGQQESYLNIRGESALLEACKKCFASLFTNRAIVYRHEKGFDHFKIALSIGVQKMVRSDKAGSGVIFTIDTESGFKDAVTISAGYGLGENVVKGRINPDEYCIFKPTLMKGLNAIISKRLGDKKIRMEYAQHMGATTRNVEVTAEERKKYVLNDAEILTLAKWACIIENHYSQKNKKPMPMDLEWAKDGLLNKLFIVQARPETVQAGKDLTVIESYVLKEKGKLIVTGLSVGDKIGQGKAHIIRDINHIKTFRTGEVLVTGMTDPDWVPVMKMAAAIVTDRGGRACFSGDTLLLTNKGFLKFENVFQNYEGLYVASVNRETLKVEWKPVVAAMKRKADLIEIGVSQTGRQKGNTLKLTPNHKMLLFNNRELVEKEAQKMLAENGQATIIDRLPSLSECGVYEQRLAYLLGALSTDGRITVDSRHGSIDFTQKPTEEKMEFIETVTNHLKTLFNAKVHAREKATSHGLIRGKPAIGNANSYRVFNKLLAEELLLEQEDMTATMLATDETFICSFLAGVIDGDGTYNHKSNRINIYCGKEMLLQAVTVACLRLGIVPQVTRNRSIWNVQIVENVDKLLTYTKRVKGQYKRERFGTKLFGAKQILSDVIEQVNYKGRIKPYVNGNLLIDAKKIEKNVLPLCSSGLKQQLAKIISSDLRTYRANLSRNVGEGDVYNISVEDNHNYVVFTSNYTPILVNNCHAAIVSRELGIPCVVGTNNATEQIKPDQKITVSCGEGEKGKVYDRLLKFDVEHIDLKSMPETKTKVMLNIGNPEEAFKQSFLPVSGVGLAREEFIVNNSIAIHPMAIIEYDNLKDAAAKKIIEERTHGYKDKKQYYVDKLAEGIATIAAAFYPKDVIVRLADFKSNEYANLIGGHLFEPKEENPMLGWRGAARYYSGKYRKAFELECKAFLKVREEMGLANIKIMVPMCRTPEEGKKVIELMNSYGLKQHKNGLEIYVMCEVPSNVLMAAEFAEIFDGFSIGSNDLTQFTLAVDRDSELISHIFNERSPAVEKLIKEVITVAKKKKKKIGICGDAPSTYPEFAEFLVDCGIDSISLSPDAVVKTIVTIADEEKRKQLH